MGSSLFARRYWGNRFCFLFLRVLRWFTSPGSPLAPYFTQERISRLYSGSRWKIRKSPDHSLFAALRGLSQLITSFIACWHQGIHYTPLLSYIVLIHSREPARAGPEIDFKTLSSFFLCCAPDLSTRSGSIEFVFFTLYAVVKELKSPLREQRMLLIISDGGQDWTRTSDPRLIKAVL